MELLTLEIVTDVGVFQDFFLVENGSIKFTSTSYFQYWNRSGTNLYYTEGNVGIGTSIPNSKLHVENGYAIFDDIQIGKDTQLIPTSVGDYCVKCIS